jgi:hypothetical protein
MYEERRRAREAEREALELAEEEEAARKEQARLKAQDEEAARWMGQIDLQQQGEEAQTEEQTQAMLCCEDLLSDLLTLSTISAPAIRPEGRVLCLRSWL